MEHNVTEELILKSVEQQLLAIDPKFDFSPGSNDRDTLEFYQDFLIRVHRTLPIEGFRIGIDVSLVPRSESLPESNLTMIQFQRVNFNAFHDHMGTIIPLLEEVIKQDEPDDYHFYNSHGIHQLFINFPY